MPSSWQKQPIVLLILTDKDIAIRKIAVMDAFLMAEPHVIRNGHKKSFESFLRQAGKKIPDFLYILHRFRDEIALIDELPLSFFQKGDGTGRVEPPVVERACPPPGLAGFGRQKGAFEPVDALGSELFDDNRSGPQIRKGQGDFAHPVPAFEQQLTGRMREEAAAVKK